MRHKHIYTSGSNASDGTPTDRYQMRVHALDKAGNTRASEYVNLYYDRTVPTMAMHGAPSNETFDEKHRITIKTQRNADVRVTCYNETSGGYLIDQDCLDYDEMYRIEQDEAGEEKAYLTNKRSNYAVKRTNYKGEAVYAVKVSTVDHTYRIRADVCDAAGNCTSQESRVTRRPMPTPTPDVKNSIECGFVKRVSYHIYFFPDLVQVPGFQ